MFDIAWQDIVFTSGNVIFFLALIPSIMSTEKPSKWSSLITAITLTIFAITYYSLAFYFSTAMVTLTALAWWVLFFQKIYPHKNNE